jgi:hypothetical protein
MSNNNVLSKLIINLNNHNNFLLVLNRIYCSNILKNRTKLTKLSGDDVSAKLAPRKVARLDYFDEPDDNIPINGGYLKMLVPDSREYSNRFSSLINLVCTHTGNIDNLLLIKKKLEKNSTEVNSKNIFGITPLMIACVKMQRYDCVALIELLIDAGADVNYISPVDNNTALICLCRHYKFKQTDVNLLIKLITKSRLTITHSDNNNKTAYEYYLINGNDILTGEQIDLLSGKKCIAYVKSSQNNCL